MRTLLAISPHLDDAIFSIGALLARHASEGWRVVIATCFTATVPSPRGFALACQLDKGLSADIDYMALRRGEDEAACAALGCEPLHLSFPEAPHRGYESASALFGPRRADDAVIASLSPALLELVGKLDPSVIYGPAGVGDHVDHIVVREAAAALRAPVHHWADLPYAARRGFDHTGFAPSECSPFLQRKLEAARAYASQLPFQFPDDHELASDLQIDGAEWTINRALCSVTKPTCRL